MTSSQQNQARWQRLFPWAAERYGSVWVLVEQLGLWFTFAGFGILAGTGGVSAMVGWALLALGLLVGVAAQLTIDLGGQP